MANYENTRLKLLGTYAIILVGALASIAETYQELFAFAGATTLISNVTATASDPGQQLILNLGMMSYKLIYEAPPTILRLFIFGACFAMLISIWAPEINEALKKLQTIKISFPKEEKKKEE